MAEEFAAILPNVKLSRCGEASKPSAVTPPTIVVQVACLGQATSIRCKWTVSPWSNALTVSVAEWTAEPGGTWFGPSPTIPSNRSKIWLSPPSLLASVVALGLVSRIVVGARAQSSTSTVPS